MDLLKLPALGDFAAIARDKVRYSDTDRQGHVNNSAFSAYLETGRVEILYDRRNGLAKEGCSFVIASLKLDFLGEITWPGEVVTGTRISRIGKSSITIEQGLYKDGRLVASAETVIVQVDVSTRKSVPLGEEAIRTLEKYVKPTGGTIADGDGEEGDVVC